MNNNLTKEIINDNNKVSIYFSEDVEKVVADKFVKSGYELDKDSLLMANGDTAKLGDVQVGTANKLAKGSILEGGMGDNPTKDNVTNKGYVDDNFVKKSGDTMSGDLHVNGNIFQKGENYATHAEDFYTKKDMIHTRDGSETALAEGVLTGITATHYDTEGNDGVLGFDRNGIARVGDKGSEQAIATREDVPTDKGIAYWNAADNKFNTKAESTLNVNSATNAIIHNYTVLDSNADISKFYGSEYWGKNFYIGGGNTVKGKPEGVDAFGLKIIRTAEGYTSQILCSSNTETGIYYRDGASFTTDTAWKKLSLDGHNHDSRYVNIDGDTMTGKLELFGGAALNNSSTSNDNMPYFLGIDGFSDGGTIHWVSKENTKVGYSDNSGKLNNQEGSYYASTDGTNSLDQTATNKALSTLTNGTVKITDKSTIITSDDSGDVGKYYRRNASNFWEWIKEHTDTEYVSLSGDTMTGPLDLPNDQYFTGSAYGINMNNSDIIGVNSVYCSDVCEETEGIFFKRSDGKYDRFSIVNGDVKLKAGTSVSGSGGTDYKLSLDGHNHDSRYVNIDGDTMTGKLTVNNDIAVKDANLIYDETEQALVFKFD